MRILWEWGDFSEFKKDTSNYICTKIGKLTDKCLGKQAKAFGTVASNCLWCLINSRPECKYGAMAALKHVGYVTVCIGVCMFVTPDELVYNWRRMQFYYHFVLGLQCKFISSIIIHVHDYVHKFGNRKKKSAQLKCWKVSGLEAISFLWAQIWAILPKFHTISSFWAF